MTVSTFVRDIVCACGLVYLAIVLGMVIRQRRYIYHPPAATPRDPVAAGVGWMKQVERQGRLLGWYCPPPDEHGAVMVFFHGNRGTLARISHKTQSWRALGIGIFAATYRGYEGNPGKPFERGLYEDAREVLDWLADRGISGERVIVYGESLGTGVAAQMALERDFRAVVLESAYTSIPELASERYPWIPCRWLIRDRFDTLGKISRISAPLLLLHGDADSTIPMNHALSLANAAPNAQLEIIHKATHLDLHEKGATQRLWFFINNVGLPSPISTPIMPT